MFCCQGSELGVHVVSDAIEESSAPFLVDVGGKRIVLQ